jgi:hypothetical protein
MCGSCFAGAIQFQDLLDTEFAGYNYKIKTLHGISDDLRTTKDNVDSKIGGFWSLNRNFGGQTLADRAEYSNYRYEILTNMKSAHRNLIFKNMFEADGMLKERFRTADNLRRLFWFLDYGFVVQYGSAMSGRNLQSHVDLQTIIDALISKGFLPGGFELK